MPCPYDDQILLTNALLVPLSLLRHRSGNPPTSSCRAAQVLATEGYKTGVGAVSRCVPRCTWYCKYGRFVGTGSYWGNSSVVERWIPDPAVGGSIPSSLNLLLSLVRLRFEHFINIPRCHVLASLFRGKGRLLYSATKVRYFSIYACHPCAGAMLIFSVSFQFLRMTTEVVPEHMLLRHSINAQLGPLIQNHFHHK